MTDRDVLRTTFSFAPPVDDAAAWHLRLDDLAAGIVEAFPGASTSWGADLGPRSAEALTFEVPLGAGVWLEGLATTPCPEVGSVMVMHASAAEAARFALWLRDSFVPSPDLVRFTSEMALNNGDDAHGHLPPYGSVDEIAQTLQQHIDATGRS
ncbi:MULTISPECIES: hypothetical protein [unclassified Streptomyces]|uniref:hypothetical protein n=1 Tax=unclassified Streptomyces TaxID=2593676 RepID=UPI0028C44E3D|nr:MULTISPECIES: hypothetical protein [unclassified Streptomyces]WNO71528.1 hypothetical protein RPQ07_07740 [Streptomyces sp. AM8-1-1]